MTIVGSNFTKINIERTKAITGKININNNISIKDVKPAEMDLANKNEKGLNFHFEYVCKYVKDDKEEVGNINIEGQMMTLESKELADKIKKSWKDKKEVPKDYLTSILNAILNKCNIQALIISQSLNLPPPIPLPKITPEQKK